MMNKPKSPIEASLSPANAADIHLPKMQAVRESMLSFLVNENLNSHQAGLVVEQVLAGNPAKSANKARVPAIHVLANATAQARKVENALSSLSAALEPYVPTSLSKEQDRAGIAYSLVPWLAREEVESALLSSKFASSAGETQVSSPDLSVTLSKTETGHVSLAASREILRLDLHRTAGVFMRQHNLYPPTTFNSEDERVWSERLLAGGIAILPVRNRSEQAMQFYEQIAQAAVSDAQALRGVIVSSSIEWQEGKSLAILARTGIPTSA